MKIQIILFALLLTCFSANAQDQKVITTSFTVDGVCDMCETRIETAVDIKGVKAADYDLDTHILTITYVTKTISEDEIHQLLNAVGHDTEKSKATDEQYSTVHNCCKYREHENH